MLSGVGPAEHLRSNAIPVVVDHPGVGQNLVDHPVVDLYFKDKLNASAKWMKPQSLGDAGKLISALVWYFVLRKGGPLATNVGVSFCLEDFLVNSYGSSVNLLHSFVRMIPSCSRPQNTQNN